MSWSSGPLTKRRRDPRQGLRQSLTTLLVSRIALNGQFGGQTHYSADLTALGPLVDWTRQMAGFWESRFDDLESLLARMDQ